MSTRIDFRAIAEESLLAHPGANLYFLLDHGGLPGLCSRLSKCTLEWTSLFDDGRERRALEVAPILVLAGGQGKLKMPRHLLEWIGNESADTSSVIALSSPLQLDVMTRRLAMRLDVRLSHDMDALLRFFDSRILAGLLKVLSDKQLISFLSVAETWQFSDRSGKLLKIDSSITVEDDRFLPLELTQEQEFRLIELSEVDQVLNVIRSNFPNLEASHAFSLQYDFVNREIENARSVGLNSVLQFSLYIIVRLLKNEKFLQSALWPEFLSKLKNNEFDFSEIFSPGSDGELMLR